MPCRIKLDIHLRIILGGARQVYSLCRFGSQKGNSSELGNGVKIVKITTTCCLSLLMIICSLATAQQVGSPTGAPCLGASKKAVIDWAQFHFDPCHTGFNPYEFVLSPGTVVDLRLQWATGPVSASSSPAIVSDAVYVGTLDFNVWALNARTGVLLWQYPTGGALSLRRLWPTA